MITADVASLQFVNAPGGLELLFAVLGTVAVFAYLLPRPPAARAAAFGAAFVCFAVAVLIALARGGVF